MDTNVFVTAKITDGLFLIDTDSLKQLQIWLSLYPLICLRLIGTRYLYPPIQRLFFMDMDSLNKVGIQN